METAGAAAQGAHGCIWVTLSTRRHRAAVTGQGYVLRCTPEDHRDHKAGLSFWYGVPQRGPCTCIPLSVPLHLSPSLSLCACLSLLVRLTLSAGLSPSASLSVSLSLL